MNLVKPSCGSRRLTLGLTQEDLAGRIELDITLMEAGRKEPTLSVLWRLAEGLQLSPGELLHLVEHQLEASKPGACLPPD